MVRYQHVYDGVLHVNLQFYDVNFGTHGHLGGLNLNVMTSMYLYDQNPLAMC